MSNEYVLDIIGALHQAESKKQINVDIKQLEKVINMLRLTGTFAKGDTKKELNAYIKSLQSQLAHIKLAAEVDSRKLKSEVDKALSGMSFKDIDALNVDENKAKLKIIIKERTGGGLNKGAIFSAPLFSTLSVFPN